jgi:flagellar assembly factor FliW
MTLVCDPAAFEADTLFGRRVVEPAQVLHFPQGLRGLERFRSWMLLLAERPGTAWLQSLDVPDLALLLVDPFEAFPGYTVDVPPAAVAALGAEPTDALGVFAPVTLGDDAAGATANLRGPIVINMNARRGVQCVVDAAEWSVREPVPAPILH